MPEPHALNFTYAGVAKCLALLVSTSSRSCEFMEAGHLLSTFHFTEPLMLNAGGDGVEIANSLPSASGISLCEDILFLIFSNFDTSNAADKGDCARCARVCSLWSEPALRTLWRSLKYALLPLYWILLPEPTGAWIKRRHSSATEALDSFFQTLGFVAPQEQAELLEYFSKVRSPLFPVYFLD